MNQYHPNKFNKFNFEKKFNFFLVTCAFGIVSKKQLLNTRSGRLTPMFSSKSFKALIFMSFINFEVTFLNMFGDRESSFILLHATIQVAQHH